MFVYVLCFLTGYFKQLKLIPPPDVYCCRSRSTLRCLWIQLFVIVIVLTFEPKGLIKFYIFWPGYHKQLKKFTIDVYCSPSRRRIERYLWVQIIVFCPPDIYCCLSGCIQGCLWIQLNVIVLTFGYQDLFMFYTFGLGITSSWKKSTTDVYCSLFTTWI
jgi:hypothetical protein